MNYDRWVPRPRLNLEGGGWLEPDFLAQRSNGLWEVVDLKTPDEMILVGRDRRKTFDAKMASYIAQVDEYREYFDDAGHRKDCAIRLGLDIHANPDTIIIAGRDATVDVAEVHLHCRRRSARLDVWTFDHVLSALKRIHALQFAGLENLAGLNSFAHLRLHHLPEKRRKYVTEIWDSDGAGFGILLDEEDRLSLELKESTGATHLVTSDVEEATLFDRWLVLSTELGSGPDGSVLQVRVDDRIMDVAQHLLFDRIVSFRERLELMRYLSDTAKEGLSAWVEYDGKQCLTFHGATGGRNLTQEVSSRAPRYRQSR